MQAFCTSALHCAVVFCDSTALLCNLPSFLGRFLTGQMPFLFSDQQHQSTEGKCEPLCLCLLDAVVCIEWRRLISGSQTDPGNSK